MYVRAYAMSLLRNGLRCGRVSWSLEQAHSISRSRRLYTVRLALNQSIYQILDLQWSTRTQTMLIMKSHEVVQYLNDLQHGLSDWAVHPKSKPTRRSPPNWVYHKTMPVSTRTDWASEYPRRNLDAIPQSTWRLRLVGCLPTLSFPCRWFGTGLGIGGAGPRR